MCLTKLRKQTENEKFYVRNGFYNPNYFELHLETINAGDISSKGELVSNGKAFSTLCHEYIHYLQDILTLNGLVNINNALCDINNLLFTRQKQLTTKLNNFFTDNDINNWNLIISKFGTNVPKNFDISSITKIINDKNDNYFIQLKNGFSIQIGTIHILEGMAALGQKIIKHEKKDNHPINPYQIIYLIVNYYYKKDIDDLLLFALCEVALTSNDSMTAFIQLLTICKESELDDIEKFHNFLKNNENFNDALNEYCNFIDIVINMMNKVFNDEMKEPKQEYINIITRCKDLHKDEVLPITKFTSDMSKNANSTFLNALNNIGEPNFFIQDNAFSFIKESTDNGSLKYCAFRNIIANIEDATRNSCDLKFCQHRNKKCDKHVNELVIDDFGCAYCNIWKSYNLKI